MTALKLFLALVIGGCSNPAAAWKADTRRLQFRGDRPSATSVVSDRGNPKSWKAKTALSKGTNSRSSARPAGPLLDKLWTATRQYYTGELIDADGPCVIRLNRNEAAALYELVEAELERRRK